MSTKRRKITHDPVADQESSAPKIKKNKPQPEPKENAVSPPPAAAAVPASEDESATVDGMAIQEAAPVTFKSLVILPVNEVEYAEGLLG